jgi:small-conductance mechanosensitive channel
MNHTAGRTIRGSSEQRATNHPGTNRPRPAGPQTPERSGPARFRLGRWICALLLGAALWAGPALSAQPPGGEETAPAVVQAPEGKPESPGRVDVQPVARDDQIRQRIADILQTTGWFGTPAVTVQDGIVFLKGTTENDESRRWAGDLARNTEGVVAVVNQIDVAPTTVWDFAPTFQVLDDLARNFVRLLPLMVVAVVVGLLSWIVARLTMRLLRHGLEARAGGLVVLLAGVYLVLRIAGLTQLALTVVGGTGLIGLVVGIAFRDITENFLASLFLSLQQPFREGDLVEVAGITGFVQRLTSRTTVLMTPDGNQVQVPNSTVFRSTLRNFTSNPNRRDDFLVGIGYDDSIAFAQEIALKVLAEHPAVLTEPEPMVLVENLGPATVNLRVYFWLDGGRHSLLKVKSSVIRLVKRAFQDAGISMPDEAREVTFPDGVPVRMLEREGTAPPAAARPAAEPGTVATEAETGLQSEAGEIQEQARRSWTPGENLLQTPSPTEEK